MKTKLFAVAGIILLVCLTSFRSPLNVKNTGDPFTKLKLKISADLFLTQGNDNSIKIDAPDEIADEIVTEVKNGTLTIQFKKGKLLKKISK